MTIQCSHCGKTLHLKPESAGKKGKCPACQQIIMIPRADEEPSAPPAVPVAPDMEESIPAEAPGSYDENGAAISDDMQESSNAEPPVAHEESGAAISDDMQESSNAEPSGSYDASGAAISAREKGAKLVKWLLIFAALFVLVFAVTIGGLMLYSALTK